jgi:predicted RNA-binding protein YlxR (DUF448 family)
MSVKKIPMRTCVACHSTRPKKELMRIVRRPDGGLLVDVKGKVSGRGAYLCPNVACIELALKSRRIEHALEVPVPQEVISELKKLVGESS